MTPSSVLPNKALAPAPYGHGPMLQRDYWAVLSACRLTPAQVAHEVACAFWYFPPPPLVRFRRCDGVERPLEPGDELFVDIVGAGESVVRVVHRDRCSLTIVTAQGHPEAGRITFGAYRNGDGDVVFHIRSRARAGSRLRYLGFLIGGDPMQTSTWTDFINRLGYLLANGIEDYVYASTRRVAMTDADRAASSPTFLARDPDR